MSRKKVLQEKARTMMEEAGKVLKAKSGSFNRAGRMQQSIKTFASNMRKQKAGQNRS